jgi:hypothetical protein
MWKATISFVTSVCLSICSHGTTRIPHWKENHGIWFLRIFRIFVEDIQVELKSGKNNRYFTRRPIYCTFLLYLAQFFLEWGMFHTNVLEKIEKHILGLHTFFFKSYRLWDNVEKRLYSRAGHRAQCNTTHATAYWIPKATNIHSEYVIFIACPLQQWLHERAWSYVYMYIAFLVHYISFI